MPALEQELLLALLPKDEADERGVVLEVGHALSYTLRRLCALSGSGPATSGRLRRAQHNDPAPPGVFKVEPGPFCCHCLVLCCVQRRSTISRLQYDHN